LTTSVITLEDVSFSYGGPLVLERVTMSVERGAFLGLVGPNGGGKSTLLKIVLGLLEPGRGRVSVLGRRPVEARQSIGYVPQFATFPRHFPVSVEETVLLGRLGKTRSILGYRKADKDIVQRTMAKTEIADLCHRPIGSLSGGQVQRVLIARALASEPEVLILDEPTANIDMRAESDIFDLLKTLNARMTIVIVSHDIGFISRYVSLIACLNRTLLCHTSSPVTGEVIDRLYGAPVQAIHHISAGEDRARS
jgi:zinc transport system ATP-binding protein